MEKLCCQEKLVAFLGILLSKGCRVLLSRQPINVLQLNSVGILDFYERC
jgi:hypothetical protein